LPGILKQAQQPKHEESKKKNRMSCVELVFGQGKLGKGGRRMAEQVLGNDPKPRDLGKRTSSPQSGKSLRRKRCNKNNRWQQNQPKSPTSQLIVAGTRSSNAKARRREGNQKNNRRAKTMVTAKRKTRVSTGGGCHAISTKLTAVNKEKRRQGKASVTKRQFRPPTRASATAFCRPQKTYKQTRRIGGKKGRAIF